MDWYGKYTEKLQWCRFFHQIFTGWNEYRLAHQGTENRTSDERPMIYLVYARPWFTDTTNYGAEDRIRIAPDDLAAVPEEYRTLFRRLSPERLGRSVRSPLA